MKLKTKILIFFVAVLIAFFGFNLLSSNAAIDLVKSGKKAGNTPLSRGMAENSGMNYTISVIG
ncbi:MAG: hypothetical protein JXB26_15705 [Candidatus Aminicenantes bacterium]|nr:hypothetical protein [Candidatus Aminicenantes bacterium]